MFARAHLVVALQLVQDYKGELPFVHYLKQYFSTHKNMARAIVNRSRSFVIAGSGWAAH